MPHPKRSLIAEERALANSFAEHSRRLNRSHAIAEQLKVVHPHFRHDFEPDATEAATPTTLPAFPQHRKAPPGTWMLIDPKAFARMFPNEAPNTFRTRRRVKPL